MAANTESVGGIDGILTFLSTVYPETIIDLAIILTIAG